MSRFRVDTRARRIFHFLDKYRHDGFTMHDLCSQLGLTPGATTRAAIARAAEIARAEGLWLPNACPQNGFTYRVTDRPEFAYPPGDQLHRIEVGVRRTNDERNLSLIRAKDPASGRVLDMVDRLVREADAIKSEMLKINGK
jgi:hypothetical protein